MERKKSNDEKKNNKVHQANARLTDAEYKKLSSMSRESGVSNSAVIRRLINDGKVEIRYDGDKVMQKVTQIQNDFNQSHHIIMQRINVNEQEISSLKSLNGLELKDPPFRIRLEEAACALARIKEDETKLKMEVDKEMTDSVYF